MAWHFSQARDRKNDRFLTCVSCDGSKCDSNPWVRKIVVNELGGPEGKTPIPKEVVVKSSRTTRCPIAFITPDSRQLLEMVQGSLVMRQITGACMFGGDVSQWPAAYYDAVLVTNAAQNEATEIENGR